MTGTIDDDRLKALRLLREPFPAENIAKLPKVNCWNCTQASKQNKGATCNEHRKAKCKECGNYITTGHIHLDYVGHAEATDRLLDADLEWSWEPLATTPEGLPLFDNLGGLWMRLTVAGVTRIGYGSANGKTGPDAIKEVIGDAIRNAGMRFGLALDLWARTDLHADERDEPAEPEPQERPMQRRGGQAPADEWTQPDEPTPQQMARIHALLMQKRGLGKHRGDVHAALSVIVDRPLVSANQLTNAEGLKVIEVLKAEQDQGRPAQPVNGRTVLQDLEMFIDRSDGPQQLHEAGLAIADEFGKGSITDADRTALQERWKARKQQLAPVGAAA